MDGFGCSLTFDNQFDCGSGFALHQVPEVAERHVFGRLPFDFDNDVPGTHALFVPARSLDRRNDDDFFVAHINAQADAPVATPGDDMDLRIVGLVDECGVRVQVFQHGMDTQPHESFGIGAVHIAGNQFLVDRAKNLEILSQREEIVIVHREKTGRQHAEREDYERRAFFYRRRYAHWIGGIYSRSFCNRRFSRRSTRFEIHMESS